MEISNKCKSLSRSSRCLLQYGVRMGVRLPLAILGVGEGGVHHRARMPLGGYDG